MTAPPTFDDRIASCARRQLGIVAAHQLASLGVHPRSIALRVRTGRLFRVHRGVYAVGHSALTLEMRWMAATLAVGRDAALSHVAAASLHGILRGRPPERIDVVTSRRHHGVTGIRVHESRFLEPTDIARRRGIPVTSVPRTLLDLGDVLDAYQLAHVIHEAAFRRKLNERAVRAMLARGRGRRAVTVLGRALELHASGSAGSRSGLEDEFRRMLERHGAPTPLVNTRIHTAGGAIEADFWWPDHRLCVEVDGSGHDRPRTKAEDRRRDTVLEREGVDVIRCTPHEIDRTARLVAARLRAWPRARPAPDPTPDA